MTIVDLILIAIALSLDAFSVSISCGIKLPHRAFLKFFKIAFAFALFQAVMPLLGHLLTKTFLSGFIASYASWISFTVFFLLGAKTIYDYFKAKKECDDPEHCYCPGYRCLLSLSIATSIDAFLVGGILGIQNSNLMFPVIIIGLITLINSLIGCFLGNKSVLFFREKARVAAGVILIILAIKSVI